MWGVGCVKGWRTHGGGAEKGGVEGEVVRCVKTHNCGVGIGAARGGDWKAANGGAGRGIGSYGGMGYRGGCRNDPGALDGQQVDQCCLQPTRREPTSGAKINQMIIAKSQPYQLSDTHGPYTEHICGRNRCPKRDQTAREAHTHRTKS